MSGAASDNMYDVIIIGGGPAGLTASIYLARACYRVLVVEKEKCPALPRQAERRLLRG